MMHKTPVLLIALLLSVQLFSQEKITYNTEADISYYPENREMDEYMKERCKLDIYYPENVKDFATVVWFHGGGLKGGQKYIPEGLKNENIGVIGVNYRLSPKVKAPAYIRDAAAAVAWVFHHIEDYGGSAGKIFVSGHSAGGYLTSMIGLDKQWLNEFGVDADDIAGLIPLSGHTITHFTVREERGLPSTKVVVDSLAPLNHVRPDAPPLLLITGGRDREFPARYQENLLLEAMMKVAGHTETRLFELEGYGHMMTYPAFPLVIEEVRRICEKD